MHSLLSMGRQAMAAAVLLLLEPHSPPHTGRSCSQLRPGPQVLLLPMLEPRSYTAEDVVELHTHGGGLCARRVLERCLEAGARLARPGEFTLRAFLNGRLDLSQAESVAQLVAARTVAAADSALAGLAGGLGQEVAALRAECLDVLVELDARWAWERSRGGEGGVEFSGWQAAQAAGTSWGRQPIAAAPRQWPFVAVACTAPPSPIQAGL